MYMYRPIALKMTNFIYKNKGKRGQWACLFSILPFVVEKSVSNAKNCDDTVKACLICIS